MSDAILMSTDQSPLYNTTKASNKLSDFFTYRAQYNSLNTSPSWVKTDPKIIPSNPVHSKQIVWDVPKNGLWADSFIEATFTMGAGACEVVDSTHLGARLFSRLDLISHGAVIASIFPETLHMLCDTLPFEKATQLQSLLNGTSVTYTTGIATGIIHIPLALFCFENSFNWLETRFIENLTVSGVVNTVAAMGLPVALAACSFKLYSQYRIMTEPQLKSYRSFQFPENKRVQMLVNDFYTETPKALTTGALAGAAGVGPILTCPNLATKTYFYADAIAANLGPSKLGRITSFSIALNGVKIAENFPVEYLKWEDTKQGGSYVNVDQAGAITKLKEAIGTYASNFKSGYVINWGMFANSATNSFSGGVSLMNTSNPTLTIIADSVIASATYELHVVHSYLKVFSVDVTGKITIANTL